MGSQARMVVPFGAAFGSAVTRIEMRKVFGRTCVVRSTLAVSLMALTNFSTVRARSVSSGGLMRLEFNSGWRKNRLLGAESKKQSFPSISR